MTRALATFRTSETALTAERAFIGCCLLDPEQFHATGGILTAESFYDPVAHRVEATVPRDGFSGIHLTIIVVTTIVYAHSVMNCRAIDFQVLDAPCFAFSIRWRPFLTQSALGC